MIENAPPHPNYVRTEQGAYHGLILATDHVEGKDRLQAGRGDDAPPAQRTCNGTHDAPGFQPPVTFEEALRRTADRERAHRAADAGPLADEYAAEDAARRQAC